MIWYTPPTFDPHPPSGASLNELVFLAVQQQQANPQQPSCMSMAMPLALMFLVFYFLLIRPQQKQARERQEMINRLQKGVRVVTAGGVIGTIAKVEDHEVLIEVADRTKIRVVKTQVSPYAAPDAAAAAKEG